VVRIVQESRILTLTRNGRRIREWMTMFDGRLTTFEFPYETNDQREIDILLLHGAAVRRTPVEKPLDSAGSTPFVTKNEPLKGGEPS
jgi:hypothetical protein